jgi:hypothetical protein
MENSIYKYNLPLQDGVIKVDMPFGAEVVSAGVQGDDIFLWAEVNPKETIGTVRFFEVFGTGHPIPVDMGIERRFIQTVFMGWMVFHIYERLD